MIAPPKQKHKPGFTLVELMLALAFFSFILLFVLSGFLLITRNYNQGVISARIHQAGRNVLEQMVRELRQSSSTPVAHRAAADDYYICYSDGTYRAIDEIDSDPDSGKLLRTDQNLTEECDTGTVSASFDNSLAEEVLDQSEVKVVDLSFNSVTSGLFELDIKLASANISDSELGTDSSGGGENDSCSVATAGSEFCDVVSLSTTFSIR